MERIESELKLAVAAAALPRVARVPAVAAAKTGRARSHHLVSTYYDTPERDLQRAGITLRLRRCGRDWTQTVKDCGTRSSGLFERREWETAVPQGMPNPVHLRATGLPVFRQDGLIERLTPLFTTDVRRGQHILAGPDWEMELAVDHGEIVAGDSRHPIAEIELELRHGPAATAFALAEELAAALPCRVLAQTKSERGFLLADGGPVLPVKAKPPALAAGTSVADAFQAIVRNCLEHLAANDPALHGPDPAEAVHQMRVALRRLRSAIKLFKPLLAGRDLEPLRAEVRWLLGHLGPVRDGDVFLAEIIAPVLEQHPDAPALTQLHQEWRARRDHDFAAALAAAAEPRFTRMLLRLGRWAAEADWDAGTVAAQPVEEFARKVLKRCHRRLLAAGGTNLAHLPAEELHQVRILGKQMRYAGEFFAGLYPRGRTKPYLALLAELQENLGGLNDLTVAGSRLGRSHHRGDWAWAAGLVCGWHETRRPELLLSAQACWKRLRKSEPFWR